MSNRFFFIISIVIVLFVSQCSVLDLTKGSTTKGDTSSHSSSAAQLRSNIVDYAKEQQGTKYNYGGRSPRTGFDCSGFVHYVYDHFDIDVTPVSRVQETEGQKIPLKDVQAGDLVFFRRSKAGSVFHVALVVDHSSAGIQVVHSTTSRGVILENISTSSYWKSKLSSARTFIR